MSQVCYAQIWGTIYLPQRHSPFDWTGTDAGFVVRRERPRVARLRRLMCGGGCAPPAHCTLPTGCAPGAGLALLSVRWTCLRISMQQNSEARAPTSASVSRKKIARLAIRRGGQARTRGTAQVIQPAKRRGTAHRRTSGGEAVPNPTSPSLRNYIGPLLKG